MCVTCAARGVFYVSGNIEHILFNSSSLHWWSKDQDILFFTTDAGAPTANDVAATDLVKVLFIPTILPLPTLTVREDDMMVDLLPSQTWSPILIMDLSVLIWRLSSREMIECWLPHCISTSSENMQSAPIEISALRSIMHFAPLHLIFFPDRKNFDPCHDLICHLPTESSPM